MIRGALALALVGQGFVLLASFGVLNPWSMAAIVVAACATVFCGAVGFSPPRHSGDSSPVPGGLKPTAPLLLLFVPVAILASYPPRAFDETLYHLPFIQRIAESGTIALHDDIRFGVISLIHELLCVPVFLALGATATHFVAVLQLLLLGALLLAWPERREAGWLAAAIVLGNPALLSVSVVTYTDTALTLFVAAGFFCLTRRAHDAHAALLAGFLLGTATGVKYLGWYFVAAGLLYAGRNFPRYLIGVAAGAAPMVARLVVLTGNPVHPFFADSAWNIPVEPGNALNLGRLLFDITFDRGRVGAHSPYTPLFAVALIIAVFFARQWRLGLICGGYLIAFVTVMPADSRYLLPLVPLVSVAAAEYLATRLSMSAMKMAAIVAVAPLLLFPAYHIVRSAETRHAGLRALERKGPGRVFLCGGEELKFFGGRDAFGDHYGPYAYKKVFAAGFANLDAEWMLVRNEECPPWWRAELPKHGELAYKDADAELWRLRK